MSLYHFKFNEDDRTWVEMWVLIPFWLTKRDVHNNFEMRTSWTCRMLKCVGFYFRIRKWKNFPPGTSKIIFDTNFYERQVMEI